MLSQKVKMNKSELKDWLFWVDWSVIVIVIIEFIFYFNTLERWKWGYWSIDLVPTILLLLMWTIIRNKIVEERRWEWIKEKLGRMKNKK